MSGFVLFFDKFAEELSHRDYLGALMNLGIERHLIGDILIDGSYAYNFLYGTYHRCDQRTA